MSDDASLLGDDMQRESSELACAVQALVLPESVALDTPTHEPRSPSDIAKEVSTKFRDIARVFVSWEDVSSDQFTISVSIPADYQIHHTELKGCDALAHILREVLNIDGDGEWSRPPFNTQEQMLLIQEMMAHGVDINKPYPKIKGKRDEDAITPLSQSVSVANFQLMEFLMSHGAIVTPNVLREVSNRLFMTIDVPVQKMEFFLSKGVNINMYDDLGGIMHTNFYHYPAHAEFLEFLLDNGLSTQIVNAEGRSLLHKAVEDRDYQQYKLLLRHGADLYLQDHQGISPLDLAEGADFKQSLEEILKEYQEKQAKTPKVRHCPPLQKIELGFTIEPREPTFRERFDALSDAEQAKVVEELKANPPGMRVEVLEAAEAESTNSYFDIPILDINPQIKSMDARHCMVIICDVDVSDTDGVFTGSPSELGITGHYYIALGSFKDGEVSELHMKKGYNPIFPFPVNKGLLKDEDARYIKAEGAEKVHGIGKVKVEKAIPLTERQYQTVEALVKQKDKQPGIYLAGRNDCITFTQDVLDKIGLGHFRVGDLVSLGKESKLTLATLSAGGRGCDNKIVEAICKEEVAQKYNVPLDRIDDIPVGLGEAPKYIILPLDKYLKMKLQDKQ